MIPLIPMKLRPAFKDYLWGGERLVTEYGKETTLSPVAESWELSCHPDGPSVIENGPLAGKTLAEALEIHPEIAGKRASEYESFPVLIKLIDAKQNLSLQVHPDDAYARRVENEFGKNEMWYIVDCDPGAEIILGFRHPLSGAELRSRIRDNTILDCVRSIPVSPGDCFSIPAGLLHAIGGGILVAEVQQSSNVTYRVYDYDRRDAGGNPRELHIDKALDVTNTAFSVEKAGFPEVRAGGFSSRMLTDWRYFQCRRLTVDSAAPLTVEEDSFLCLLCLDGGGEIAAGGEALPIRRGQCVLLPAGAGDCLVTGACALLATTL